MIKTSKVDFRLDIENEIYEKKEFLKNQIRHYQIREEILIQREEELSQRLKDLEKLEYKEK